MRLSIHNNDIIYHLLNNYYELGTMLSSLSLKENPLFLFESL